MDVGDGEFTLGEGIAAHLVGGNAGQVGVVHKCFRVVA
jgi:hypothetical protein